MLDKWPPTKKALWKVLMSENLNDGHYIKAFDLVEKLHDAVVSIQSKPPCDDCSSFDFSCTGKCLEKTNEQ